MLASIPITERSLIIKTIPSFRNRTVENKNKKNIITCLEQDITNKVPLKLQTKLKIHPFQTIIKKMMYSFGDNMFPLTFSSLIIGDHIKSWLNSWFTRKLNWNLFNLKKK